jgi:hypothetical protein
MILGIGINCPLSFIPCNYHIFLLLLAFNIIKERSYRIAYPYISKVFRFYMSVVFFFDLVKSPGTYEALARGRQCIFSL